MGRVKNVKKYNYFYKITNNLNNHFYYGIHSTDNLDDGYMGSGTRLNYAYKKYGIENFTKEILKFFDTRKECAEYEAEMVTEELIHSRECYNIVGGGDTFATRGTITAKDKEGNFLQVSMYDERWLNGELVGSTKGRFNVIDNKGNIFLTTKDDEKYISGEVKSIVCGTVAVKFANNQDEKLFRVSVDDERLKTGELIAWSKNKILAKDKNGKVFYVDKHDERFISGTLTPFWVGRKHKEETINKVKQIYKEIKHQQGEKNSQYGTCWVTKDNENKKIKKEELDTYIQMGWIKGRKIKK
jgi:hypothetical protein